jgi:F5/8 type C domain/Dolichyl-phosphate-mannose-protein mannosyltransferase
MINRIAQSNRKWEYAFVVYLSVLAILLTALANLTQVFLSGDSITWFAPAVQALFNGAGYNSFAGDTFRGPLYPFVVYTAATFMGGRIFEAGLVVGVLACLLFVTGVFLASRKAFDARLAFLLSIAVGLNATVLFNSVEWLTDMLFAALGILSLCMMNYDHKKRFLLGPVLAGVFGGLALTTRWNGLFLLIVAVLYPTVNPLHLTWRRRIQWLCGYLVGFVVAASPWLWINWQLHGSPLYNTSDVTGFHVSLISPNIRPGSSLIDTILGDPVFFAVMYLRRLLWDGWNDVGKLVPLPLLLFVPAGLFAWLRAVDRQKFWFATHFFVFWCVAASTHFESRFYILLLPAVLACPLLFFLSDLVVDRLTWKNGPSLRLLGVSLLLIGIGWFNYSGVWSEVHQIIADRLPQVQVAEWLARARSSETTTTVATRFYSGARYFITARAGLATTFLASAAEYLQPPSSVSHVFVEEGLPDPIGGEVDPTMFSLSPANPRLEAIYFKPDAPRAVLYRVLKDNQVITATTATASSVADALHGAQLAVDGNSVTGWMSALQDTSETTATLILDLGAVREINRIWVLPASATAFPRAFNLQRSVDGQEWVVLAGFADYAPIERQDPQVFAFDTVKARFVRIAGASLRPNVTGKYQMGFNEVRVSLGTERKSVPFEFMSPDFVFDAQTGGLETCVRNIGTISSTVQVVLTVDQQDTILMESDQVSSRQVVCFRVPLALLVSPGNRLVQTEIYSAHTDGLWKQKRQVDIVALHSLEAWREQNLVPNAGLESDGEGWRIQAQVHFDRNVVHSGLTSLRVDKADFAAPNFYHVGTPSVPLAPDMQYVFGGWIKTKDLRVNPALVSGSSKGQVWALPRPSAISFDAYGYGGGTQDWVMWSGRIATPSQPDQVSLGLFVTDFRSGSVWLDDVFVLPLYTVTAQ